MLQMAPFPVAQSERALVQKTLSLPHIARKPFLVGQGYLCVIEVLLGSFSTQLRLPFLFFRLQSGFFSKCGIRGGFFRFLVGTVCVCVCRSRSLYALIPKTDETRVPVTSATATAAVKPATIGCLLHHRQSRSGLLIGRAKIGSC